MHVREQKMQLEHKDCIYRHTLSRKNLSVPLTNEQCSLHIQIYATVEKVALGSG